MEIQGEGILGKTQPFRSWNGRPFTASDSRYLHGFSMSEASSLPLMGLVTWSRINWAKKLLELSDMLRQLNGCW